MITKKEKVASCLTTRCSGSSRVNFFSSLLSIGVIIIILIRAEVSGYGQASEYGGPLYKKLNGFHAPRGASSDDLIVAKPTRAACLTSDDLDCPEFKDTDDLLVPTSRNRQTTDSDVRRGVWPPSPKNKIGNVKPEVYESSGIDISTGEDNSPCSNDDEDCLTFSGAEELLVVTSDVSATIQVEATTQIGYAATTKRAYERQSSYAGVSSSLVGSPTPFVGDSAVKSSSTAPGSIDLVTAAAVSERKPSGKIYTTKRMHPFNSSATQDPSKISYSSRNQLQSSNFDVYNNYYQHGGSVSRSLEKLTINIGLILGIAFGIAVLLLVLAFALFKYRNQFGVGATGEKLVDYKPEKSSPYVYEACKAPMQSPKSLIQPLKVDVSLNLNQQSPLQSTQVATPRKKDVKEWYV